MNHASLTTVASGLAERGIATLRYQFPFMEGGSKRPMRQRLRMRPSALRSRKPNAGCQSSRSLQEAARLAVA